MQNNTLTTSAPVKRTGLPNTATLTIFRPSTGTKLGKTIHVDGAKTGLPFPDLMKATTRTMSLAELVTNIDKPNVFITSGVFDESEVFVKAQSALEPDGAKLPVRSRTKALMSYPNGQGLMVIDNDFATETGCTLATLVRAVPALAEVQALQKGSSGSYITRKDGSEVRGCTGEHLMYVAKDAADNPRAAKVLHKRCILAGDNHSYVGSAGQFLQRSVVDLAVAQVHQPVFLAANLDEGLTQDVKAKLVGGDVLTLDTHTLLPDLTAKDEATFIALMAARHDELIPAMKAAKASCVERMVAKGYSRVAAIAAIEGASLLPDAIVTLADGSDHTVAELLADPEHFNGQLTLDPLEPDYRDGAVVGKLYLSADGGNLYSQAHGGRNYRLLGTTAADDFAEELVDITPAAGNPINKEWLAKVPVDGGPRFDLFNAELAPGIVLHEGLALADGRVITLTKNAVAEVCLQAAGEDAGGVMRAFVERIIPAFGVEAAVVIMKKYPRQTAELGSDPKEKLGTMKVLGDDHHAKARAFATAGTDRVFDDQPVEDYEAKMARLAAEKAAAVAAQAADRAAWLKSFAHIAADPFGELHKALPAVGLAGDIKGGVFGFMTITSSAFMTPDEQVKGTLRGATGVGKSVALDAAVALCHPNSYHQLNSGSPKSLFYKRHDDDEDGEPSSFYVRRCVVLPEADALLHEAKENDDFQTAMKVLLSEGCLSHEITLPGAPGQLPTVATVKQAGPTNMLTSSTRFFEGQMENRVVGFEVDQSPENEATIRRVIGAKRAGPPGGEFDVTGWHNYGMWLREGRPSVRLSFAPVLADMYPGEHSLRSFNSILSVASVSALMNKANRQVLDGQIIATLDDYSVAWGLLHEPANSKIGAALDAGTLGFFRKMEKLIDEKGILEQPPSGDFDQRKGDPKVKVLHMAQRLLAKELKSSQTTINRFLGSCQRDEAALLNTFRPLSKKAPMLIWVAASAEEHIVGDKERQLPTPKELGLEMEIATF